MTKKVKRSIFKKLFINIEKEEAWLNNMCEKGYALRAITNGYYLFERCNPGSSIYRIEFLKQGISQKEKDSYVELMQELNVERIASFKRWSYFCRDSALGEFEIYSDIDSQIEHYKRINIIWYMLAFIFIFPGLSQTFFFGSLGKSELILNIILIIIGIFSLIPAIPLSRKIKTLRKKKWLFE